ncbi:hypothetical protein BN7_6565 [Wickerhamomyces ciferrii]|uniref:SH3 domain-containing protein n=1 Tax=Wickerhamomyces ciferrii (strain ATCC 14091 / BCRC 22168 / CBS 111 / JCM 3599 / NBRC 0793 / NRRL Y-1031 F-60-10) TaxID=1206466 RepID=K0L022_WICCF|nr:uncharacterized protein BN7_6565 [Wickerhamomyces ciferrii]CCH46959.1 hypothetical protein BN7_6565 [Wickerhamomyces ciferrii]
MSGPLVNRSLATLKTVIITDKFYDQIVGKLPNRYQAGAPPIDGFDNTSSQQTSSTPNEKNGALIPQRPNPNSNPSNENKEFVEAIYDYKPQQPEDLELRSGDKVQVLEHTSPDWWKGLNGSRSGMFPSNYVKPLEKQDSRAQAPSPAPSYQSSNHNYPPPQQYNQPPYYQQSPQFPPYGSPVPYQQPQQQVYQQPPQQQEVVVQQQEQSGAGGHVKKFGSKLGNAAIFGAGATIGSDIVNSIF